MSRPVLNPVVSVLDCHWEEPLEVVQLRTRTLDGRLAVPEVEQHVEGGFVDDLVDAPGDLDVCRSSGRLNGLNASAMRLRSVSSKVCPAGFASTTPPVALQSLTPRSVMSYLP